MKRNRPIRLMYAAGPGDVIGTFRYWKANQDDPTQVAVTYSSEFFQACQTLDAKALVISSNNKKQDLIDGPFHLRHRPVPLPDARGLFYHLSSVLYGLRLVFEAMRFGADYVIIAEGSTHWFVLRLLNTARHRVIPSLHSMLWLPGRRAPWIHRVLNRSFFRRHAYALMSASYAIDTQVNAVSGGSARPTFPFLPTYRHATFSRLAPPPEGNTFRVLFAGRIETEKGVFLLLDVARILNAVPGVEIAFDLCGDGSVLNQLRAAAADFQLAAIFRCHGHCSRETMRKMFEQSHVFIVPTKSNLNEGFNQVVVEAVLAGRPVITSVACPALEYVKDAALEVPPDGAGGYAEAVLLLSKDKARYEHLRKACEKYQDQFYDNAKGWSAALKTIISRPADTMI